MPCFLLCYLLVVPLEMGLGSGDLSSSPRSSLIKNPTSPPLCALKIGGLRETEEVSKDLPAAICPSWIRRIEEEAFFYLFFFFFAK